MLTESQLIDLIAVGENAQLDFKREIELESAAKKAEFVKDVLSIANSAQDTGYIIVGVEDSGNIVGITSLEEERIQQIIQVYITPPVVLDCSTVSVKENNVAVGVIQIRGQEKPHKVARGIEKLNQNEVFVRHGSVVVPASPEEIIRLHNGPRNKRRYQCYLRGAAVATESENFEQAIDYYSKAINLMPSAETYILRGQAYLKWANQQKEAFVKRTKQMEPHSYLYSIEDLDLRHREKEILGSIDNSKDTLATHALRDFTEAIILAENYDVEKEARILRLELFISVDYHLGNIQNMWDEDLTWLKSSPNSTDRAKGLYLYIKTIALDDPYFEGDGLYQQVLLMIGEIIQLGLDDVGLYRIRAMAHSGANNYGLALLDLKNALSFANSSHKTILWIYQEYAWALSKMGKYKEIFELFQDIPEYSDKQDISEYVGPATENIVEDILLRCAMDFEFAKPRYRNTELIQQIVRFFLPEIRYFEDKNLEVANILKKIVQ